MTKNQETKQRNKQERRIQPKNQRRNQRRRRGAQGGSSHPKIHKLFLTGLYSSFTDKEMLTFFKSSFKSIKKVDLVKQRKNKRFNQGCGFLELTDEEEVKTLLEQEYFFLRGRKFSVKPHRTGEELRKYKESLRKRRLFIHSVEKEITDIELKEYFQEVVPLEDAYLIRKGGKGRKMEQNKLLYGYIILKKAEDVEMVLERRVFKLKNSNIIVMAYDKNKHERYKLDKKETSDGSLENPSEARANKERKSGSNSAESPKNSQASGSKNRKSRKVSGRQGSRQSLQKRASEYSAKNSNHPAKKCSVEGSERLEGSQGAPAKILDGSQSLKDSNSSKGNKQLKKQKQRSFGLEDLNQEEEQLTGNAQFAPSPNFNSNNNPGIGFPINQGFGPGLQGLPQEFRNHLPFGMMAPMNPGLNGWMGQQGQGFAPGGQHLWGGQNQPFNQNQGWFGPLPQFGFSNNNQAFHRPKGTPKLSDALPTAITNHQNQRVVQEPQNIPSHRNRTASKTSSTGKVCIPETKEQTFNDVFNRKISEKNHTNHNLRLNINLNLNDARRNVRDYAILKQKMEILSQKASNCLSRMTLTSEGTN